MPITPIKLTKLKRWYRSLQTRSTLAIIITAGVLIEVTSAVQYWYARKGIREEVERRAVGELKVRNRERGGERVRLYRVDAGEES